MVSFASLYAQMGSNMRSHSAFTCEGSIAKLAFERLVTSVDVHVLSVASDKCKALATDFTGVPPSIDGFMFLHVVNPHPPNGNHVPTVFAGNLFMSIPLMAEQIGM